MKSHDVRKFTALAWALLASAAALAAAPQQTNGAACPCDSPTSQGGAAGTTSTGPGSGVASKHAIYTKGTGNNRVAGPTLAPLQQVAPAASSSGGTTKRPGHVTINR